MTSFTNVHDDYWNICVEHMYNQIKKNNLVEEFVNVNTNNRGFMFNHSPVIIKIVNLTSIDGHSGASFACCCRAVYKRLIEEKYKEKKRLNAQFRGIVKSLIKLKKIRLKVAQNVYSPGNIGFLNCQQHFYSISKGN